MKVLIKILALYQSVIACIAIIMLFFVLRNLFFVSGICSYEWGNIFLYLILIILTIVFCSLCSVKLLFSSKKLFIKWSGLTFTGVIFAILFTSFFLYLLVMETDMVKSNRNSQSSTSFLSIGDIAPNFVMEDQHGNSISLNQFRGQFVLLDFWATWCTPCLKEIPELLDIYEQNRNKKFVIIGINIDKNTESYYTFLLKNNFPFSVTHDIDGNVSQKYGVLAVPSILLIDNNGIVVAKDLRGRNISLLVNRFLNNFNR